MHKLALSAVALAAGAMLATRAVRTKAVPSTDGGTITGDVKYQGDPPPPGEDPGHEGQRGVRQGEGVARPRRRRGQGYRKRRGRLKTSRRARRWSRPKPVFDQKGCEYLPHVLGVPGGHHDRDPEQRRHPAQRPHHLHRQPGVQPGAAEVQEEDRGEDRQARDADQGQCDAHGWMHAWWISQDHPYYAVTDAKGAFKLADVPPGDYEVELWHEKLGKQTAEGERQGEGRQQGERADDEEVTVTLR